MNKKLTLLDLPNPRMIVPIDLERLRSDLISRVWSKLCRRYVAATSNPSLSELLTRRPTTGVERPECMHRSLALAVGVWLASIALHLCICVCVDGVSGRLPFSGHACDAVGPKLLTSPLLLAGSSPRSNDGHKHDVNGVVVASGSR